MLAKITPPTNDFYALARYLVNGKGKKPHPDRVAWIRTKNLPTDDPELAAKFMTATAELSARTKNAAYHTIIGWHPDEKPTPEQMQEIAIKTLERAGLAEHEALIMGHGDANHAHLHMMINRVNPATGKAWSTSHDYARLDKIMRELSDEHGFRYVPAHTYNREETDHKRKGPNSKAFHAAKRGANTKRPQWSRQQSYNFGARLSEELSHASTWEDLEQLLDDEGLSLEAKGTGFVVGDQQSYSKLSTLQLSGSAKGFAKAFKPSPKTRKRRYIFEVDGVDITRAMQAWGITDRTDVRHAVQEAVAERAEQRRLSSTSLTQLLKPALAKPSKHRRRKQPMKSR